MTDAHTTLPRTLGPWMAAAAYIILLAVAILWRFVRGPWREIKLLEGTAGKGTG